MKAYRKIKECRICKNEIIKREMNYIKKDGNLIFTLPKLQIINKKNFFKNVK